MNPVFSTVLLLLCCTTAHAQSGPEQVNGSFSEMYKQANASLHYEYDEARQIHDYSGNWDLDGDGQKDSLLFVGNGGAHLYFHLRLVLSTDKRVRDLPFFLDLPCPGKFSDLQQPGTELPMLPQFVVHDFDGDGRDDIYLNYDPSFSIVPKKWNVTSCHIVLKYVYGKLVAKDLKL